MSIPSGFGSIKFFQDAQIFKDVKYLSVEGLDPKHELTNEHVITMNITNIFSNVKGQCKL